MAFDSISCCYDGARKGGGEDRRLHTKEESGNRKNRRKKNTAMDYDEKRKWPPIRNFFFLSRAFKRGRGSSYFRSWLCKKTKHVPVKAVFVTKSKRRVLVRCFQRCKKRSGCRFNFYFTRRPAFIQEKRSKWINIEGKQFTNEQPSTRLEQNFRNLYGRSVWCSFRDAPWRVRTSNTNQKSDDWTRDVT